MSDRFGYGEIGLGIESVENSKQTTNANYIRSMSNHDLADWIAQVLTYHGAIFSHPTHDCDKECPLYKCCNDQPSDNIEDWLNQEKVNE